VVISSSVLGLVNLGDETLLVVSYVTIMVGNVGNSDGGRGRMRSRARINMLLAALVVVKTVVMSTAVVESTTLVLKLVVVTMVVDLEAEAERRREGKDWESERAARQSQGNSLGRDGNDTGNERLKKNESGEVVKDDVEVGAS
jgi:hypothetical protein